MRADGTGARPLTSKGAHGPMWTRDGKAIVFGSVRSGGPAYWSIDPSGGPDQETPLTILPPGASNPSWSLDGSLVSFATVSKDGNARDLSFTRVGGVGTTGLTTKFWVREWAWSPDGSTLAFVVGRSTGASIWTVGVKDKELTLLYKGFCSAPAYSPDGRNLAFAVPDVISGSKIKVIDLETRSDRLIAVRTFDGGKITWSPDSSRLFFCAGRKSHAAVWSVASTGEDLKCLTPDSVYPTSASFSPDGKTVAFTGTSSDSYSPETYICSTSGTGLKRLNRSRSSYWMPMWSPDRQRLAFQSDVNHSTELFVGSKSGSREKAIAALPGNGLVRSISWYPDGKKLLLGFAGRLFVVDSGKRVTEEEALKPFSSLKNAADQPRIGGDSVFFTDWLNRDAGVSTIKLDGQGYRLLTNKPKPEAPAPTAEAPAPTPEAPAPTPEAPAPSSEAPAPTPEPTPSPADPSTNEDKPSNDRASAGILVASASLSFIPQSVLVAANEAAPPPAEEGNPHSGLGMMGPQENLAKPAPPGVVDLLPTVSPQGNLVAFIRNDQIWLVDTAGEGERQLTQLRSEDEREWSLSDCTWSPKGDSILFQALASKPGKLMIEYWLVGLETGTERLVRSEDVVSEYGVYLAECTSPPVFFPDGDRILFTSISSGEPHVASMKLDGSDSRELVAVPSSMPAIDSDGRMIAFVDLSDSLERIRVLDLTSGKVTRPLFAK